MSKRHLLYLCLLAMCFVACRDKNDDARIILDTPIVSGNKVFLSWSPLIDKNLYGYLIFKVADTPNRQIIDVISVDRNITTYTDTLALAPYVQYYVTGNRGGGNHAIESNRQTHFRTDIDFMYIAPKGVVPDKDAGKAYIYSNSGDIALCDLATRKLIKQIATNCTTGHCCLGTYNGRKELYVPRADGELFIYDAATLDKIDQVHVGSKLYCVAYNNGKLFISEDTMGYALNCYSRATRQRISQVYSNDKLRTSIVPGSNTNIMGTTTYGAIFRHTFNDTGGYVEMNIMSVPMGPAMMWYNILEFIPGGNKMLVSAEGVVVEEGVNNYDRLAHGTQRFTSFYINEAMQQVHTSCTTEVVQTYSLSTYQLLSSKGTRGFPVKLINYNGTLLSISATKPIVNASEPIYTPMYTFIEQL